MNPVHPGQASPRARASPLEAARKRAVLRGLAYFQRLASRPQRLAPLGSGFLYGCAFMATTAADREVRRIARALALQGWLRWRIVWRNVQHAATADDVAELVHGHLAAQRLGFRFAARRRWLRRQAARFEPEAFLGWDPALGPPPTRAHEPCDCGWPNPRHLPRCANSSCRASLTPRNRHRAWCLALTTAYCGDRFGVRMGRPYRDVLQWLPHMPEYPTPARGYARFHDAVYTVTHVVYTLNDYGRWRLDPAWLPREYAFLATHLDHALALDDPDMVGEFLDSIRAFGVEDTHPALRYAMEFLIDRQNPDGSWSPSGPGTEYSRFHTTWAVLDGLRDFAWQGTGVSFPALLRSLKNWAAHRRTGPHALS